jgi:putative flippase GtrA
MYAPRSPLDATARTFLGYVAIGIAGVTLYVALLWAFGRLHVAPFYAFTLSYVLAVTAQFFMNKYWNFRAFDRTIHQQARTYVVVTAFNYLIMIAVEEFGLIVMHLSPIAAYGLSIPIVLPFGYLAQRFLTFGPGIFAFFRRPKTPPEAGADR